MNRIPVADAHVDVLMKLLNPDIRFHSDHPELAANYASLQQGGVATQVFALFVEPKWDPATQLYAVLREIDAFYEQIASLASIRAIRTREDLRMARQQQQLAALLSLEGAGCLRGSVEVLRILHHLGVRGVGLTWNDANELADGCGELRGGGLTRAGRDVLREMQHLSMWIDLAHLHDAGVRDVLRLTDGPVMASHANARAVHAHRRNLTDDTIREIIRRQGWIGLTFEARFVAEGQVRIDDVFRHLDHILELGGQHHVGFGSDFDGTSNDIVGLTASRDYAPFAQQVLDRYGRELGSAVLFGNFEAFLQRQLPP
ncbi:diguanylate cyclase [Alicyclobacillus hesperidum]|uniref:Diguanylate cyclase n=1 Tax=Alicyclobacillus hesperidum TaxID=89784 RepID=A0A1H2SLN9_9BACL|nr:dipeptidase [Alicyclobacillus hesperidum]GLV12437.1 diguanylate cyclase [Alicyclobacillus hesperidum]SDW32437.1 membrane dipeptidase [Alicyclobacillus hesperidum]